MIKIIAVLVLLVLAGFVLLNLFTKPSNDRDWSPDQALLPTAEINGNLVTIHNIRNFKYSATDKYEIDYYDKTFEVNKLKNVYYIVEPFSTFAGSAHTFLSFEFEGDEFVAVSVEIRKEKGEKFSAIKGLFNQYEMMYVVGDEQDLVKLRSNYRKDKVYVYPTRASLEKKQALFLDMMSKINSLKDNPEFYNTLTNTCTTKIVSHTNKISPKRVPFSYKILLPGYSDKLAYDLGLIDTDLSFEEARNKFLINERAEKFADDPKFSVKIRE